MKRLLITITVLSGGFLFMNFTPNNGSLTDDDKKIVSSRFSVPDNVKEIIFNHCYDCHWSHSKNIKGKGKLKFDAFDKYKKAKVIGKLQDIADEVEEGKMPPKKAVKKYPHLKLSKEDAKILIDWANSAMDEVMN